MSGAENNNQDGKHIQSYLFSERTDESMKIKQIFGIIDAWFRCA